MDVGTIESNKLSTSEVIVGESVFYDKEADTIIFVKEGDVRSAKKGDTIFEFDREQLLPKYVFYYLQNMQVTQREAFEEIV